MIGFRCPRAILPLLTIYLSPLSAIARDATFAKLGDDYWAPRPARAHRLLPQMPLDRTQGRRA